MKKNIIIVVCVFLACLCLSACDNIEKKFDGNAIKLAFNEEEVIVDLYNNDSVKDFVSLLPLVLVFDDYNSSEKTSTLPDGRKLDISDAPEGYDPSKGEFGYYSPWGNIVIYHKNFSYARGIVPLGKFRSGEEKFTALDGKVSVRIELINNKNIDNSMDKPQNPNENNNPEMPSVPPILPEYPQYPKPPSVSNTISIKINDVLFEAEIYNNETANLFKKMFPLTLKMSELNGNEKYCYLSNNFPTNASRQDKIIEGDIMLYGENCLVLFYESFHSNYSYTKVGRILLASNLKDVVGENSISITFE